MERPSPQPSGELSRPSISARENALEEQPDKKTITRKNQRLAYVLIAFRIATLALILAAALRVLVCPRPLSDAALSFLKWSLGSAAALLWTSIALQGKQKNPDEEASHFLAN